MIEPCCCERQLPEAVEKQKGRAVVATSGDVTTAHWYKAMAYQAGATHRMRLQVMKPDGKLMRHLRTWMQRGWTTGIQLTAPTDCSELVRQELQGYEAQVSIAADKMMQTELMAMEGERGLVMIIGPMLSDPQPGSMIYTVYSRRDYEAVKEILAVIDSRHKAHRIEVKSSMFNVQCSMFNENELDKENQGEKSAEAQVEGNGADRKRVRNHRKARTKRDGALGGEVKAHVHRAATGAADDAQG